MPLMFTLVTALLLATGSVSVAETIAFKAQLSGKNEVPPNNSTATGQAEATLDTATKLLTWTVTYSGLTGSAIGAHLHGPGEHGKNAGIAIPFQTLPSPIKGSATLTDTQMADLMAARWYVNIHTGAHPGGEIRGQLTR